MSDYKNIKVEINKEQPLDEVVRELEPNYSKETELDCKAAFKAGQQSRQEEINNLVMSNHHLSMQLADSGNFYDYEKKRADELQNMVVKVLAELESIPYWDRSGNCETAIKLLKVAS